MRIKRNEKQVYILEAIFALAVIVLVPFLSMLAPSIKAYYLVFVLGILLIAAICMFGYRRDKHYLKTYVSHIVISCIMMAAIVCFALGLIFNYTYSSFSLNISHIFGIFLPIFIISITTELLRYVIFHNYYRKHVPVVIFTTISIIMNIVLLTNSSSFANYEAIFITICTTIIPIIATETLCSYLCYKVGLRPALIYKLCARLYPFVLPILPNLGNFIFAVAAIVLPAIIFLFTYNIHLANRKDQRRIQKRNQLMITIPIIAVLLVIVALVAGIFKHQIIAIASDSMQPTFARGDAVLIEKMDSNKIREGDILVFKHDGIIITHRVRQIVVENDNNYFITQGDNQEEIDSFVTEESQVIGRVVGISKYIGYPTVWLNDLFKTE